MARDQGSALIYSKKVEYLYQLVHHTLDILSSQKQAGTAAANKKQSANALAEDEAAFQDAGHNFLLLEDLIKEGKDIDLDTQLEYNPMYHGYGTRGAASAAAVASKGKHEGTNPMLAALLKEDRGASFRLNSCQVHASGALVIGSTLAGGGIAAALDALVSPAALTAHRLAASGGRAAAVGGDGMGNDDDDDDGSIGGHDDGGFGGYDGYGGSDDDDDEGGGGGGGGGEEASMFVPRPSPPKTRAQTGAAAPRDSSAGSGDGVRQSADPWAMLDPHDPSGERDAPSRPGRTWKIPPLVDEDALSPPAGGAKQPAGGRHEKAAARQRGALAPAAPVLSGLAFPEFEYVVKQQRAKAAGVRLATRRAMLADRSLSSGSPADQRHGDFDSDDDDERGGGGVDFGVYGGDYGGGDYGGDDDDGEGGFGGYEPNPNSAGQLSPFQRRLGGFGDDNDDASGHGSAAAMHALNGSAALTPLALDEAFDAAPKSYAELCRSHIASFMRGVDRYAHESNLSKRVGEWQDRLLPVLEQQATRRDFDIHEYGAEVMADVSAATASAKARNASAALVAARKGAKPPPAEEETEVSFAAATEGKAPFEVARLFLAALQLSNNGNVVLHHADDCAVCGPEDFRVEVVAAAATCQDRFDSYRAPSLKAGHR